MKMMIVYMKMTMKTKAMRVRRSLRKANLKVKSMLKEIVLVGENERRDSAE